MFVVISLLVRCINIDLYHIVVHFLIVHNALFVSCFPQFLVLTLRTLCGPAWCDISVTLVNPHWLFGRTYVH